MSCMWYKSDHYIMPQAGIAHLMTMAQHCYYTKWQNVIYKQQNVRYSIAIEKN